MTNPDGTQKKTGWKLFLLIGAGVLVVGIGIPVIAAIQHNADQNANTTSSQSVTEQAQPVAPAETTDDKYLRVARNIAAGTDASISDADMIAKAHEWCDALRSGQYTGSDLKLAIIMQDSQSDVKLYAAMLGAGVNAYCPEFVDDLE